MARLTDEKIKKLEEKGFKRWQKAGMDRLYINPAALGIVFSYYNTGNISSVYMTGENGEEVKLSNAQGRRIKAAKTFLDVETGTLISDNDICRERAEAIIASV